MKQKMQLVKVNSKSLMNFSVGILQILVKLVQVENFELISCSAAGTGMLVKRALTSNETKVSSSGFVERCLIFWMKSVLSLAKDEVLPSLLGLSTQRQLTLHTFLISIYNRSVIPMFTLFKLQDN